MERIPRGERKRNESSPKQREGCRSATSARAANRSDRGREQPPALLGAPHPFQAAPLPGWALLTGSPISTPLRPTERGGHSLTACSAGLPRKDATLPAGVPSSLRLNHFHNYRNSMDASAHVQTQKYDPVFYT